MSNILLIDDDPTVRLILKNTLQKQGYNVSVASNGEEGLNLAQNLHPALILCDWMMPGIDGLEVCRQIKANRDLSATFFILLTARTEVEDRVKGLDNGADDFLSKPVEMNELKARVRAGLRLYQLNQDLVTQKQALQEVNQKLQTELDEAAEYVRSLLPSPLKGKITTDSLFIPSAKLGGDCFDYNWLDEDNLAFYLLDVSGHGVGSALLSVAVLNIMRSQSLPHTNFYHPGEVLTALNRVFYLRGDKFFTIWYGVYNVSKRQLVYANAGHPPAVMINNSDSTTEIKQLGLPGVPISILPDEEFVNEYEYLPINSNLYIFSDGAYELRLPNGKMWQLDDFINLLSKFTVANDNIKHLLNQISAATSTTTFDDDLSLLKLTFS